MDCRDEWADRVNQEQIEWVLQLGEFLMMLPADQKPMRMTLAASKLWGEGVARSQEEAYVMLSEACVNSEVMKLIEGYDTAMHQAEKHMDALKAEVLCGHIAPTISVIRSTLYRHRQLLILYRFQR